MTMPDENAEMIEWALYYASKGFDIFPLHPKTKSEYYNYPKYPNESGLTNSWKAQGSHDPERIKQYWTDHPDANIGCCMGQRSGGIYCIDLDKEHAEITQSGMDRLREWENETGLILNTETAMDISGSGGSRIYYRSNRICSGDSEIFKDHSGVDTRGDGNYVVLPPSVHPNGNRYEWEQNPEEYPIIEADETFYKFWSGSNNGKPAEPFKERRDVGTGNRTNYLIQYISNLSKTKPDLTRNEIEDLVFDQNKRACISPLTESEIRRNILPFIPKAMENDRKEREHQIKISENNIWETALTGPDSNDLISDDLDLIDLDSVSEQPAEWLIPKYIPKGQITLLCGTGGTGKTSIWCSILSSISNGVSTFIEGSDTFQEQRDAKQVMFFSAEDAVPEVLKGRIRRCHGNMKAFRFLDLSDPRFEKIQFGSPFLDKLLDKYRPAVVVFDPLQNFIPSNIKMSDRNAMRQSMRHLIEYGARYGTTSIVVMHTNKQQNVWGRSRMADSADLWDIARSVIMVGEINHEDHTGYISHEKCNYGATGDTIIFKNDGGVPTYQGKSDKKDKDFVKEETRIKNQDGSSVGDCADFILSELSDGPMKLSDLDDDLLATGYSKYYIRNAKNKLKESKLISYKRDGFSGECSVYSSKSTSM